MAREDDKGEFVSLVHPPIAMPKPWVVRPRCRGIYKNLDCGLRVGMEFKGVNGYDELTLLTFCAIASLSAFVTILVLVPCCGVLEAFSPRVEKVISRVHLPDSYYR